MEKPFFRLLCRYAKDSTQWTTSALGCDISIEFNLIQYILLSYITFYPQIVVLTLLLETISQPYLKMFLHSKLLEISQINERYLMQVV